MRKRIITVLTAAIFLTPLIILPFTVDFYNPPKELFVQLIVIFCLMLWIRMSIQEEKIEITDTRLYLLLLIFCAILGASVIFAKSRYLGLRDYGQILTYLTAFFICSNTVNQKEAVKLTRWAFIAGFISALYINLQYVGLDFIRYPTAIFPDWRFKLYATFGNPDFAAGYLIMVFPIGVSAYITTQKIFKKFALLAMLAVIYTALMVTFSLGALSGLFLSMLIMTCFLHTEVIRLKGFISSQQPIRYMGKSVAILAIGLAIISLFFFRDNPIQSQSIVNKARASLAWRHGLENRLILYKSAYRMVRDNPLLGVGIGNFKLRFPEYRGKIIGARQQYIDSEILDKERDRNVLNEYLQFFAETGIIGVILFIIIILTIFKVGVALYYEFPDYRRKLFVLGLMGGVFAFLIHSLVSFPLHVVPNAFLFWMLVGLLVGQLPKENKIIIKLNISPVLKQYLGIGAVILAIALAVCPLRCYLSEVFLKRMIASDRKGLIENAIIEARTSLLFDPNSNAALYVANYALLHHDFKTAIQSIRKALQNNNEINYHVTLAEIYNRENLPRDCIDEYSKAISLNPLCAKARLRLAELYAENGMDNEAEAECQLLLINNPENDALKKRLSVVIKKLLEKRLTSTYYGKIQYSK